MSRSCLPLRIAALGAVLTVAACQAAPAPGARAPASARAFPHDDARTALAAAARGLRSCGTEGRSEEVVADLRFAPDGKVADVDVSTSDDATTSCVRTKLAEVAVTPFDGDPVTMRMRVRL